MGLDSFKTGSSKGERASKTDDGLIQVEITESLEDGS